ncbi:MAG: UDP-4-amino-4,6-dideoxy-N-acetyl-beta-L-altrosamine N-acetyltransferase [Thermosulfidibacteraceae bacterium]|jgi:UDP-4-amino-4,6-dideoxy-N-acetyl-beta-L-altrosamine N-acetyltransferase
MVIEKLKEDFMIEDLWLKNFVNLTVEESELVRSWRNYPEVRKWSYMDHEIGVDEHRGFIKRLKGDSRNAYFLAIKEGKPIGVISLVRIDFKNRSSYFGIYANPFEKMPNVGTMLGRALLKLAFEIINLHTLKLEVLEGNDRAIGLYRKLGFKEEGRLREFVFKDGRWFDVIVMGMTEEEYYEMHKDKR